MKLNDITTLTSVIPIVPVKKNSAKGCCDVSIQSRILCCEVDSVENWSGFFKMNKEKHQDLYKYFQAHLRLMQCRTFVETSHFSSIPKALKEAVC